MTAQNLNADAHDGSVQRLSWPDNAKGILILLVVFGHVWRGLEAAGIIGSGVGFRTVDDAIYLFHMPAFFIISGFLFSISLQRHPRGVILRNIALYLVWPLVLWSYITAIARALAGDSANRGGIDLWEMATYPFPPKDVYWFLGSLVLFQLTALLISRFRAPVIAACLILATALAVYSLSLPSILGDLTAKAAFHLPFFLVGLVLRHLTAKGTLSPIAWISFVAAEALALWTHLAASEAGYFLLTAVAALGFIMGVASRPKLFQMLNWLGQQSMAIYVIHIIPMAAARIVLLKAGVTDPTVHIAAGVLAGITLPCGIAIAARRLGISAYLGLGRAQHKVLHTQPSAERVS